MQISVSSTLAVYHDGQFWVGLAEHVEDGRYGVARIVFGAEPSDEEILQFVAGKWEKRSRGGESPQAASDEHQGAAGSRGTAGSDEAGVGSSKKPASRG